MRPLDEWDETDLTALISNEVQEGLRLDYKQSDALARTDKAKAELAKDVSAFANSAGGRIIYGIVEQNQLPISIDQGSDQKIITREWIEQVISSRIAPRIVGVIIKPVPLSLDRTAYIIDIPQATTFAPHQANHRYFRRFNFESVAMEDYEVRDAMRRTTTGAPYLRFEWTKAVVANGQSPAARLRVFGGNLASEPIIYALIRIFLDKRLIPDSISFGSLATDRSSFLKTMATGAMLPVIALTNWVMPGASMPFFRESEWQLVDVTLPLPPEGTYLLGYEFAAPGVSRRIYCYPHIDGHTVSSISPDCAELFQPKPYAM